MRRYQQVLSLAPGEQVAGLFQDGVLPSDVDDRLQHCWSDLPGLLEHTDDLGGFQFIEVRSTLPDELLMYADKMSMAHGLEVRVPYLDKEIVEYAERLPATFKVRAGKQKWLHRRVSERYLPASILRRKKRGFAVNVVDQWFRGSLEGSMDAMLGDENSLMYSILQPKKVRRLMAEHKSGASDHHKSLFSLVMFEQWLRAQVAEIERGGKDGADSGKPPKDR